MKESCLEDGYAKDAEGEAKLVGEEPRDGEGVGRGY